MEIEVSDKTYLMPENMVGQKEVFKIVLGENDDCVVETMKPLKDGSGTFPQYELFLENKHGEKRSAQFLMKDQLKPLLLNISKNTKDWINQFVMITGEPKEKGDKIYHNLILSPSGNPEWEWVTENV